MSDTPLFLPPVLCDGALFCFLSFSIVIHSSRILGSYSTMLGALLLLLMCGAFANGNQIKYPLSLKCPDLGDPTCSDGRALLPASVSMSSTRKSHQGKDKCADGDLDTVDPLSTISNIVIIVNIASPSASIVSICDILFYSW